MQVLYIFGNGFDLNLKLETSYNHFYEYYKSVESENTNVRNLKKSIKDKYPSWSDLELALGAYTTELKSKAELDDILLDINEELSKFLLRQEEKLAKYEFDRKIFFEHLSFPERLFLPADKEKIFDIKKKWSNHQWNLNVFTFNYTRTIERILGEKTKGIHIGNHTGSSIQLVEIKHIHGDLDNDMVIGVNDISQIANESFHSDEDILEFIVKPECNRANKNNIDRDFSNKIKSANLICIFGSSIGDTDKRWWELIGERLKSDCYLLCFTLGEEVKPRMRHLQARQERDFIDYFLGKTKLNVNELDSVKKKIFIGLNTKMFDGLVLNSKTLNNID